MSLLRIERVNALPATLDPTTLYIVKSAEAGLVELVFTSTDGLDERHVLNKADVSGMISDAVGDFTNIQMAADITARDALVSGFTHNTLVLTLDASDDATVDAGAALYFYDVTGETWYKVSEFESMDVVLEWSAIQNKPTSSVADIDDAVTKRHTHANKTEIDKIGEDLDGLMTYNGLNIEAYVANAEW